MGSIPIELLAAMGAVGAMLLVCVFGANAIERRRRARHEQAAAELHFEFHDKDQSVLPESASRFHLMRLGQVRMAERIMRGEANGVGVTVFQISNTFGLGIGTRYSTQTVVCFDDPRLRLPWFFLRPSALVGQLPPPPGLRDVPSSEIPLIAGVHALASEPDQSEEVVQMFDAQMHAALSDSPGISVEGWENLLLIYYPGREVPLEQYPGFIQLAFRNYGLFKGRPRQAEGG